MSEEDNDNVLCARYLTNCIFVISCMFNLAWIIPDLIFAYEDSMCVETITEGFAFNLSTWLQVDAYVRISFLLIILLIGVGGYCGYINSQQHSANQMLPVFISIIVMFTFTSIWAIVGSVLYWGYLN